MGTTCTVAKDTSRVTPIDERATAIKEGTRPVNNAGMKRGGKTMVTVAEPYIEYVPLPSPIPDKSTTTIHNIQREFHDIDQHARNAPMEVSNSIAALASYLTEKAHTDEECVRAFFVWIANRVDQETDFYESFRRQEWLFHQLQLDDNFSVHESEKKDVVEFLHYHGRLRPGKPILEDDDDNGPKRYRPPSSDEVHPEELLQYRRTYSSGYAVLFKALCSVCHINCMVIEGYSKDADYRPGMTIPISWMDDHFWNAVCIDGEWRLIDSYKAAGFVNNQGDFERYFDDYYFFTEPEDFIHDHLPIHVEWQLVKPPITKEQFEQKPLITPHMRQFGLSLISPLEGEIGTDFSTGSTEIAIKLPDMVSPTLINNTVIKKDDPVLVSVKRYWDKIDEEEAMKMENENEGPPPPPWLFKHEVKTATSPIEKRTFMSLAKMNKLKDNLNDSLESEKQIAGKGASKWGTLVSRSKMEVLNNGSQNRVSPLQKSQTLVSTASVSEKAANEDSNINAPARTTPKKHVATPGQTSTIVKEEDTIDEMPNIKIQTGLEFSCKLRRVDWLDPNREVKNQVLVQHCNDVVTFHIIPPKQGAYYFTARARIQVSPDEAKALTFEREDEDEEEEDSSKEDSEDDNIEHGEEMDVMQDIDAQNDNKSHENKDSQGESDSKLSCHDDDSDEDDEDNDEDNEEGDNGLTKININPLKLQLKLRNKNKSEEEQLAAIFGNISKSNKRLGQEKAKKQLKEEIKVTEQAQEATEPENVEKHTDDNDDEEENEEVIYQQEIKKMKNLPSLKSVDQIADIRKVVRDEETKKDEEKLVRSTLEQLKKKREEFFDVVSYFVICDRCIVTCMPLPDVDIKHWGPGKRLQDTGLIALSHQGVLVKPLQGEAEITFGVDRRIQLARSLDFVYKLCYLHGGDENISSLQKYVLKELTRATLKFKIRLPKSGPYRFTILAFENPAPKNTDSQQNTYKFWGGGSKPQTPGSRNCILTPTLVEMTEKQPMEKTRICSYLILCDEPCLNAAPYEQAEDIPDPEPEEPPNVKKKIVKKKRKKKTEKETKKKKNAKGTTHDGMKNSREKGSKDKDRKVKKIKGKISEQKEETSKKEPAIGKLTPKQEDDEHDGKEKENVQRKAASGKKKKNTPKQNDDEQTGDSDGNDYKNSQQDNQDDKKSEYNKMDLDKGKNEMEELATESNLRLDKDDTKDQECAELGNQT
ncbi:LOW QUALITY PROTEIN: uncharacterized protein LOC144359246 [Saccoglossus kowalevskii]